MSNHPWNALAGGLTQLEAIPGYRVRPKIIQREDNKEHGGGGGAQISER